MYREIKKIINSSLLSVSNYGLYIIKNIENESRIVKLSGYYFNKDILNFVDINRVFFAKNHILISFKDQSSSIIDINTSKEVIIQKKMSFTQVEEDKTDIYIKNKEEFLKFDKEKLQFSNFEIDRNLMLKKVIKKKIIFTISRKPKVVAYDISLNEIWQSDVSELGSYQENNVMIRGKVNNIYADDTAVYVLTGLSIVAFDLDTGAILWHIELDTYQSRGLLNDGYLYTTSNAYINKVEIASGAIVYQKKLSGVTVQDELQEMPIANLTWHKDYIWAIMDTSPNALLKIDPNTGLYAEVLDLGTLGIMRHCHDPKFYQNRMYLLDYDQTLHICEEEALT